MAIVEGITPIIIAKRLGNLPSLEQGLTSHGHPVVVFWMTVTVTVCSTRLGAVERDVGCMVVRVVEGDTSSAASAGGAKITKLLITHEI